MAVTETWSMGLVRGVYVWEVVGMDGRANGHSFYRPSTSNTTLVRADVLPLSLESEFHLARISPQCGACITSLH